jgi:hypothetical protein
VPGDEQLEDGGEHLLAGERAVAGGDDEVGDEVLAGLDAFEVEQRAEVGDDRF